ncbi:hypothetical protein GCM10022271_09540 [Corallibacter vietnamensis]|uniref:Secretion system C-terminal sorting domain-containing protein n=1 Tax=Corallibacter vietnamensis TaxID=904130 RepID=A0ABP7H5Z6_9FLAO
MKKTITLLIFYLTTFGAFTQNIDIPDTNFKNYLLANSSINTNGDNEIQLSEAHSVTGTLNCSGLNISNLSGIENFINITELLCYNNHLSTLDVSQLPLLEKLYCANNNLEALDVSLNENLIHLTCQGNDLVLLNVANGNNTNFVYFSANSNANLTCIEVDDAQWATTNWTNISSASSFSESCSDYTYIPDDNFEQWLIDHAYDTQLNNYVATSDIENIVSLNLISQDIDDLTGIEGFAALEHLFCSNNNLESVNLSENANLKTLIISLNNLTELDLTNNYYLETLNCSKNQLNSLQINSPVYLAELYCQENNLTHLNIYSYTHLEAINISDNPISSLGLSTNNELVTLEASNTELTSLSIDGKPDLATLTLNDNPDLAYLILMPSYSTNVPIGGSLATFSATNCPALQCIEVLDSNWSASNWTQIDASASYSEDCHYNETYVPDDAFEQALIEMGVDFYLDDYVNTNYISGVNELVISSSGILDLTGIEDFTALQTLYVGGNGLQTLDVSQNTNLIYLSCGSNMINTIDVSNNPYLETLIISNTNLTTIDVSNNSLLKRLEINNTNLGTIDVSNNLELDILSCQNTGISSLNVSNNAWLTELRCANNALSELNVSNNTMLEFLGCQNNQITSLDLSLNASLNAVFCNNNALTSLNIQNGNNQYISPSYTFNASNNPDLECIQVDSVAWSESNWPNIDSQTSFNENCESLSINDNLHTEDILIYPNPTNNVIYIKHNNTFETYAIESITGKTILKGKNISQPIDISNLPSGIYFLSLEKGTRSFVKKIIKN